LTTEAARNQDTQPITLSLSKENIKDLDEVRSIIKKPSGLIESRSGSARILLTLGVKVFHINRMQHILQAGTELSEFLKELSYVPQSTPKSP